MKAPSSNSASPRSTPSSRRAALTFRPHYWLSDEWFTPDDVPGIAIPFYLAHPRLAKLELAQMLEVEGGDPESCLMILRHEAGHAIDNAYQLRRRPTRRRLFGPPATPYPEYYTPKPYSKSFVQHLDHWYAQSHPDEDFAETFAVWLDPQLDVGDAVRGMAGAAQARVHGSSDARPDAAEADRHVDSAQVDPLREAAQDARASTTARSASTTASITPISTTATCATCFPIRRNTRRTRRPPGSSAGSARRCARTVASFTDSYQYTIDQLIEEIIERCRELNLRLIDSEESTKIDFMVFLTVQTMNYLHSGRHRVAL